MGATMTSAILGRCEVSDRLSLELRQKLSLPAPCCKRHDFASCAVDLALEHHRAIVWLTRSGLLGAAGALLRPLLEATSTAFWLVYCASDDQVERFAVDPANEAPSHDIPMWSRVLPALVPIFPEVALLLQELAGDSPTGFAKWLHKYTHGGTPQLVRREIASGWMEEEVLLCLLRADLFVVMAASVHTLMKGARDLENFVFDERDRLEQEGIDAFGIAPSAAQPRQHPTPEPKCVGVSFVAPERLKDALKGCCSPAFPWYR